MKFLLYTTINVMINITIIQNKKKKIECKIVIINIDHFIRCLENERDRL